MLGGVRKATSMRAAKWRLTWFLKVAKLIVIDVDLLQQVRKALKKCGETMESHSCRWVAGRSNTRIEALNRIFQATKCRARRYRNCETFISIIYLLAVPIQNWLNTT